MARIGVKWKVPRSTLLMALIFFLASVFVSAERNLKQKSSTYNGTQEVESDFFLEVTNFIWQSGQSAYHHVWPEMKFGWRIVAGTIIGFLGAAFGSVGGVGGGGIFVPMLTLIIGFDPKSATAISKCMIMGTAGSTVYYNLKLRHPTLEMPIVDYDLALLFQPMLMLGISIGVTFNVIFADWMVTVLLIILFLVSSTKAFIKGVETWKKETIIKKEATKCLEGTGTVVQEAEYRPLPGGPRNDTPKKSRGSTEQEVPIFDNVYWKELGLLIFVWITFLALQLAKNSMATCSIAYWVLNLLQIPVAVGMSLYESIRLYTGQRVISSEGEAGTNWSVHLLFFYCSCGIVAGVVGGLLGLGGGFILGPLLLELGVPPQVSSATATFAMTFSSSMSVVEYYLLKRFPVPYAAYFFIVSTIAALFGQHVVRKAIIILGRASLIIFILAATVLISAITLGGIGISNMVRKIVGHEYMGFEDLCSYGT